LGEEIGIFEASKRDEIAWYFIHISHPANGRKEVPEKSTNKHVMPWIKILNKI